MPKTVLTVFLSSTAEDLKSYREAVYERLRPISFLKCIRMEDFGAPNADGVKACRDGLAEADLFVGLIGMRRGWEPDGDAGKRSISEMEHEWAKERGLARFIHVSPENFPVPGHLFESEDKHNRLKAFRAKIMSEHVVSRAGFDTAPLLASAAVENLLTQIIRDQKLVQSIHASGAEDSTDLDAAKLLTAADAQGLTKQAENAGVERLAVFELARRISPDQIGDFEQALKELSAAVDVAMDVAKQGRGGNLDDLVGDVLGKVSEKTRAGDFDGAAQEADRGFERWEREEADRRQRSIQSGIALLEAGLEQDILRREAVAAAKRVQRIVALEYPSDDAARFEGVRRRQRDFYERGRDRGTNFDIVISIEIARLNLIQAKDSARRGIELIDLGNASRTLGKRESGTERLEQAIMAYQAALEYYTRERDPLGWAGTKNNVGLVLQTLGERESGTERLEQAVDAYRAALQECTRERVPLQWAMTQNNLGNALGTLGTRERGTGRLVQAVEAFLAALQEYTRERVPLDWAMTQNNLANALATLGEREIGTKRLEQAVEAYRAVLKEYPRERVPLDWAMTQNNLGNALARLGDRESGTERLEQAVQAYQAALLERTRECVPLDWAMTQNNLGNALARLGGRESGTERLEQALQAYQAALNEYTRERVPLDWAMTQSNLGIALSMLGERESGMTRLEEAVAACREALEIFEPAQAAFYIDGTRRIMARAEALLAERRKANSH